MTWYVLRYQSYRTKWKTQDHQHKTLDGAIAEASDILDHLLSHEKREYARIEIARFEGIPNNVK